ncbi:hypothetical protein [Metapseudomonas boanensis]|uniref:Uncharacterized protein n=1 Tax=Metapseudomonas boanensis TaxID=2822138 RepID=A0ABS5XK14_9GAMM|nr:hypothetical protein [Pseudomonas boanensis]MBT8768022.1 hypothetical protein [Pseudomonas boanensis]
MKFAWPVKSGRNIPRLTALVASGELRPLFKRWKQPYPFDKDLETPHAAQ